MCRMNCMKGLAASFSAYATLTRQPELAYDGMNNYYYLTLFRRCLCRCIV
jgi:hypothetical protein